MFLTYEYGAKRVPRNIQKEKRTSTTKIAKVFIGDKTRPNPSLEYSWNLFDNLILYKKEKPATARKFPNE